MPPRAQVTDPLMRPLERLTQAALLQAIADTADVRLPEVRG
jgi:hypothetical protein